MDREDFFAPEEEQDTENMTPGELKEALRQAEEMYALLLQEEPGEDSEEYPGWLERLEALDDRMDEWRDLLEEEEE